MDALPVVMSVDLRCRLLHVYHKPNTYLCSHKQSDLKVIISLNALIYGSSAHIGNTRVRPDVKILNEHLRKTNCQNPLEV